MKDILGLRVARRVIEALYTVTDVSYDYPSIFLVSSLLDAAISLKKIALSDEKYFANINTLRRVCVREAEYLLRATRQRLSDIPATREFSRMPFELPPSGVYLNIEVCEYVINDLINNIVDNEWKHLNHYVIVDSVDSPSTAVLPVRMPEHKLQDASFYVPLSHEAFHCIVADCHYFSQNETPFYRFFEKEPLRSYIDYSTPISLLKHVFSRGNQNPPKQQLKRLLEEIVVELLDFNFTYIGNFKDYMEEELSFFAQHIREGVVKKHSTTEIIDYFVRTFIVKIWDQTIQKSISGLPSEGNPSLITKNKSELRDLLREHLKKAQEIMSPDPIIRHLYQSTNLFEIQHDIEDMSEVLDVIFQKVWEILERTKRNKNSIINKMEIFSNGRKIQENIRSIAQKKIIFENIEFPHIFIRRFSEYIRKKVKNETDRRIATRALLISLKNSQVKGYN